MEYVQVGQFIAAFALVVGLIGLMGMAMRKYGNPGMRARRRSEARLHVVETLPIDTRSRLLLIRRDNVEHLLVKSGDRFEVVEGDIPCDDDEDADSGPSLIITDKKERNSYDD